MTWGVAVPAGGQQPPVFGGVNLGLSELGSFALKQGSWDLDSARKFNVIKYNFGQVN